MTKTAARQRQLLWNVKSIPEGDPPQQSWIFVIVNEPREIKIIEQRIREELSPTDQQQTVTRGLIQRSDGLHYKAITVDSYKRTTPEDVNLRAIYKGPRRRDEKLGSHRTTDGLATYIDRMFN